MKKEHPATKESSIHSAPAPINNGRDEELKKQISPYEKSVRNLKKTLSDEHFAYFKENSMVEKI